MPDTPPTGSVLRKFRQQLSFVDHGIRKRFVVCMVGLVTIAMGSAIADVYLRNLDPNIVAALQQLKAPTLPVFELVCAQGPLAGATYYTSDPGKALITGQCSDIGKGKGLILRGLAARAPYFHNGVAANLQQVVNFYD
ncbi:MAG TPA: hypothetical protein VIW68_11935 [Candidatus Sulfotelmatobacter sp.]